MPDSTELEPEFDPESMLGVLAEHGVEFVVVGGIAVRGHGTTRTTEDLDIMARANLANLARLAEALHDLHAKARGTAHHIDLTDPLLLARAPGIYVTTRYGNLDIMKPEHTKGAPSTYDKLREGALVIELAGSEIPVAGRDDLIRMKKAAGRDQDRRDIAALTRTDEELEQEASPPEPDTPATEPEAD